MKSILVHVDGTPRCAVRLQIAGRLAARHGAQLTVLFAATLPLAGFAYGLGAESQSLQMLRDLHDEQREQARAMFEATAAGASSWAELDAEWTLPAFLGQALLADLVVLGQHDPADPRPAPPDFLSSAIIGCGRPVLVVPYAGDFATVGNRVLVAWTPAAGAARALAAALPLLRRAREVTLVEWQAEPQPCRGAALDIERYCRLHGVDASLHRPAGNADDIGALLLSQAADLDADLLVMGCYGHSRMREFIFGGATRTVLSGMTLPLLTSH